MPLNTKIGGQASCSKDKEDKCLTEKEAKHIYKKVESGSIINVDTVKQEMDQDIHRMDNTNGEMNPYHDIILKAERR